MICEPRNILLKKVVLASFPSLLFLSTFLPCAFCDDKPDASSLARKVAAQEKMIKEMKQKLDQLTDALQETKNELRRVQTAAASLAPAGEGLVRKIAEQVVQAYEKEPRSSFLVSGYGTAGFQKRDTEDSTFNISFNPGFHFQLYKNLHFNSEVSFAAVSDDTAELDIEFAQADLFAHDNVQISAGKMLLPFNAFGERLHPDWINKLPSLPPIYGSHHGSTGVMPGIIPVLTDIGVQARGGVETGRESMINYALYVVNGPRLSAGHDGSGGVDHVGTRSANADHHDSDAADADPVELEFGENFTDNNSNKTFGGRVGFIPFAGAELGWSGMFGDYDEDGHSVFIWGADAELHYQGVEVRGEYMDLELDRGDSFGDLNKSGYYVQASFRPGLIGPTAAWSPGMRKFELVGRYGSVDTGVETVDQVALGFIYWLAESAPLKFSYEFNDGSGSFKDDRFLAQWAYGF